MRSPYFSFFHSYLNYGNIAWCSTSMTKIKKLYSKQKQAIKALSMTSEDYSGLKIEDMMKKLVFSTFTNLIFTTHRSNVQSYIITIIIQNNNTTPEALENKFEIVHHYYPTRHSKNNFIKPKIYFNITKFATSSRGACLWNSLIDKDTKTINLTPVFERKLKNHLIQIKNIRNYIQEFYSISYYSISKLFIT